MSRALLTAARASLPANAKPWQIAQEVARLAEAQWVADGRPSAWQQAHEDWARQEAEAALSDRRI